MHCAFECSQKTHKCVKVNEEALSTAINTRSSSIDAACLLGAATIADKLREDIRLAQAAADRFQAQLSVVCLETKTRAAEQLRREVILSNTYMLAFWTFDTVAPQFESALTRADSLRLCELLQPEKKAGPEHEIGLKGDKIVVRTLRSISWDNGTVFEGFVDAATGKPDGEGTVTWGATAGRSKRKSYSGLFTAGFTAERVSFDWNGQRPGQAHKGHHAYHGTVEVCHPCCHFLRLLMQSSGFERCVDRRSFHRVRHHGGEFRSFAATFAFLQGFAGR